MIKIEVHECETWDLLTWVTADRSPPPMNARGASVWESLYTTKFENVGLSVPAAKNASESVPYDGENAMEDTIPGKMHQWLNVTKEIWWCAPFKPSLLFRDGVVAIRDPSPGRDMSKTSIASWYPQYILHSISIKRTICVCVSRVLWTYLLALGLNVIQWGATNRSRWSIILYDARNYPCTNAVNEHLVSSSRRNKNRTLPSEASSNLIGLSRTDAKKQNDEGSLGEAAGNQVKSRIGADCWKMKFDRADAPGL